ncbi:SH3 domain-containing protein [Litorimonas sp. RW-G-Af-16]|uniref:SH3 domain-containing protein n=1 Tax=Litorimonas sp. RW-G-Af-16 TaxID=3241168 RepID=UPI00390CC773
MKTTLTSLLICAAIWISPLGTAQDSSATDEVQTAPKVKITRVVEDVPQLRNLYHVSAQNTPSGFVVPRFVSLKFGRVNGRTGPSLDHPIAWQYQRRSLPLLVVAETEMWRRVRDISGDEAWVRKPTLSGDRYVLTLKEAQLHAKPKDGATLVAISDRDALLKLEECNDAGWCRVRAENGLKGWTARDHLWGAQSLR